MNITYGGVSLRSGLSGDVEESISGGESNPNAASISEFAQRHIELTQQLLNNAWE